MERSQSAATNRMQANSCVEAFILAGGVSSRMGQTKALLDFAGAPLIVRTAQLLKPLANKVTVIGSVDGSMIAGLHVIRDADFGVQEEFGESKGPLVGIATALRHSQSPWNLILACDLPYVNGGWLGWLIRRALHSNAQVVVPLTSKGPEPLAAMYRRECYASIERSIADNIRKVTLALSHLEIETLHESEWREFDLGGLVLKNMNTLDDYQKALEWWRAADSRARNEPAIASAD
jgi:molybdopterin-guanine dinucleotide biosynthesis protein A